MYDNYNQEHKPTEVSYYPAEDLISPKKKKHNIFAKVFGGLLCAAIISVGSVGGYIAISSGYFSNNSGNVNSNSNSSNNSSASANSDSKSTNKNKSLIELAAKKDRWPANV